MKQYINTDSGLSLKGRGIHRCRCYHRSLSMWSWRWRCTGDAWSWAVGNCALRRLTITREWSLNLIHNRKKWHLPNSTNPSHPHPRTLHCKPPNSILVHNCSHWIQLWGGFGLDGCIEMYEIGHDGIQCKFLPLSPWIICPLRSSLPWAPSPLSSFWTSSGSFAWVAFR